MDFIIDMQCVFTAAKFLFQNNTSTKNQKKKKQTLISRLSFGVERLTTGYIDIAIIQILIRLFYLFDHRTEFKVN